LIFSRAKAINLIGSGLLEFGEFCQLAAKFLVEEDDEALKKELKEAFRIYDKDQLGYISTGELSYLHSDLHFTLYRNTERNP
jgi:Ca2+-binding EF-hand superfamily protein